MLLISFASCFSRGKLVGSFLATAVERWRGTSISQLCGALQLRLAAKSLDEGRSRVLRVGWVVFQSTEELVVLPETWLLVEARVLLFHCLLVFMVLVWRAQIGMELEGRTSTAIRMLNVESRKLLRTCYSYLYSPASPPNSSSFSISLFLFIRLDSMKD